MTTIVDNPLNEQASVNALTHPCILYFDIRNGGYNLQLLLQIDHRL